MAGKINILRGNAESRVAAAMGAIMPIAARTRFGTKSLLSRKTGGEKLFNVDDAGMLEVTVKSTAEDATGKKLLYQELQNLLLRINKLLLHHHLKTPKAKHLLVMSLKELFQLSKKVRV